MMTILTKHSRLIIALDFANAQQALQFVEQLDPNSCRLKVGFELFVSAGPSLVEALVKQGFKVFLDLKLHDIPNTVAAACRAAARLGVWMLNVHASGGRSMLEAAKDALAGVDSAPLLIAVTVLTSLDDRDLGQIGIERSVQEQTLGLAALAQSVGIDGVVCSAHEAQFLRQNLGDEFVLVTPGIRLHESSSDDQKRIMTPVEALRMGSDYLVIGRPITQAADPGTAVRMINAKIGGNA
ncbi:MAG: orotidine-5'-phosphate decarboxylase [Gammaproteobacteria bacterium]|nr:orotidine-5'-phosphate decarboxylase [Gammaproteobacteria bacterium]